jgi:predicted ABC-type transport system involved in lysophospholipase L1 biosynthesis ATPase subunit
MQAAVLTVTHGRAVADRAQRTLTMRDGVLHGQ